MRHPLLGKLEYESRVKPEIAAMVDRIAEMTDAEIDAADTPLPWFKQALKILRSEVIAKNAGQEMAGVTFGHVPDIPGKIAYWHYGDEFVKINKGMEIEIMTGTLIFFPDQGGVWVEHVYGDRIGPHLASLSIIGQCTKSEYMRKYKEALLKRVNGPTLPTTSYTDPTVHRDQPLAGLGVRIYR